MAKSKAFLLRINPDVLGAVQRWANDDLRSLNGQIEFLLRKVMADSGRAGPPEAESAPPVLAPPPAASGQPADDFID